MKEMRKIKLYITASLNGKIATSDGSVKWIDSISNPEKIDHGYSEFYKTIDTTIQGNNTYAQLVSSGTDFPYPEKKNYVLTRKKYLKSTKYVEFISSNHIRFIQKLKKEKGKDIWLIGGGQINTMLLNENLIDEVIILTMPIILMNGIELFEAMPKETKLTLTESKSYSTGGVILAYKVEKTHQLI